MKVAWILFMFLLVFIAVALMVNAALREDDYVQAIFWLLVTEVAGRELDAEALRR